MLQVAYLSYRTRHFLSLVMVPAICNLNLASVIIFWIFPRTEGNILYFTMRILGVVADILSVLNLKARF